MKSLACRMNHHSFRVTRADVRVGVCAPALTPPLPPRRTCATPCPRGLWTTPAWWTPHFYLRNRFTWPASDNNRPGIPLIYSVFTPPIPFPFFPGGREGVLRRRSLSLWRCCFEIAPVPLVMLVDGILGDGGIHSFIVMWFAFLICFKVEQGVY